jgi:hypothetical protein
MYGVQYKHIYRSDNTPVRGDIHIFNFIQFDYFLLFFPEVNAKKSTDTRKRLHILIGPATSLISSFKKGNEKKKTRKRVLHKNILLVVKLLYKVFHTSHWIKKQKT